MSAEVRNAGEGTLRWVVPSGTGVSWATGSAPVSGLFGYVRSFDYTSAATYYEALERGVPHHRKRVSKQPITINVTFDWSGYVPTAVTGSGHSVPMFHLEHKAAIPEAAATGRYHQFHGVVVPSYQMTEGDEADTFTLQMNALAMIGPTASGFLG